MNYWLVKSEPEAYSWSRLVKDGQTDWTGVRSYAARNNLRAMAVGDRVLYYHSVTGKEVVGIAEVSRAAFPDPTVTKEDGDDWSAVTLRAVEALARPVGLAVIKADAAFEKFMLIKQSRLSVVPVAAKEFRRILVLAK